MTTIIAGFVLAALCSGLLTYGVRAIAFRIGAIDKPDGVRKLHGHPVATIGGTGVWLSAFIPVALLVGLSPWLKAGRLLVENPDFFRVLLGLFAGGSIALALGLWDDLADMRARNKLFLQVVAGSAAWLIGIRIDTVVIPFLGWEMAMGVASFPLTVFWFVGCMNAINLVDGLDGLASGLSLFVLLSMTVTGALFGHTAIAFLSACVAGAILGFLKHNFHPATIFLGDSGSMFLGFAIATLSVSCSIVAKATGVALLIPITALGLPIMDVVLAMMRRWVRKLPFSAADRDHIHHRLMRMGLGHRQAVLILWGICFIFSIAALLIALEQAEMAVLVLGSMTIASLVFARIFGGVAVRHFLWRVKSDLRQRSMTNTARVAANRAVHELEHAKTYDDLWGALGRAFEDMGVDYAVMNLHETVQPGAPLCYEWRSHDMPAGDEDGWDVWEGRYVLIHDEKNFGKLQLGRHIDGRGQSQELLTLAASLKSAVAHQIANILDEQHNARHPFSVHLLQKPIGDPSAVLDSGTIRWPRFWKRKSGTSGSDEEGTDGPPSPGNDKPTCECVG